MKIIELKDLSGHIVSIPYDKIEYIKAWPESRNSECIVNGHKVTTPYDTIIKKLTE